MERAEIPLKKASILCLQTQLTHTLMRAGKIKMVPGKAEKHHFKKEFIGFSVV